MSRCRSPIFKRARRLEFSILENNNEFNKWKRRTTKPGQHGTNFRRRSNLSFYGRQFVEKQKLKSLYNISEKYLKRLFTKAQNIDGDLGINLLIMLESRLDNLVFRTNFAPTRRLARQLVNHNHILLNGKKHNCSSTILHLGDKITLKEKMRENEIITKHLKTINNDENRNFSFSEKAFTATYVKYPLREHLNSNINESLVIELLKR